MIPRIIPFILAALLVGAHFLRQGSLVLAGVSVLAPLVLFIKKEWSLWLAQGLAYLAVVIWLSTTVLLVRERLSWGQPWGRSLVILGAVTLFTLWAGLLLNSPKVKAHYSPSAAGGKEYHDEA